MIYINVYLLNFSKCTVELLDRLASIHMILTQDILFTCTAMIWSENEARIDNAYDLSLRAWKRNCFYARKWFALAVCLSTESKCV